MPKAGIQSLPLEVLERVGDFIAVAAKDNARKTTDAKAQFFAGPTFINPITGKALAFGKGGPKKDLLAFAQTCHHFRLAALRHLPELVRDITIASLAEMERSGCSQRAYQSNKAVRDEAPLRGRLSPNVHHITLDFNIPITATKERLKKALLILCLHPSLGNQVVFPHLEGISFSARFVASYTSFENVRRDWQREVTESWGVTGWQAKALGGLASFSAFIGGSSQGFGSRLGESECLFLKWRPEEGESWLPQYDLIFKSHQPPPVVVFSNPTAPIRLLVTPFPPNTPGAPPFFVHPAVQLSHYLMSKMVAAPRSSTSTPLRPLSAYNERMANAYLIKEFDDAKVAVFGPDQSVFWDERATALVCALLVDKLCFRAPQPDGIDALPALDQLRLN